MATDLPAVAGTVATAPGPDFAGFPRKPRWTPVLFVNVAGALRWARISPRDYGRVYRIRWCTHRNGLIVGCHRKAIGGDGRVVYLHSFILGRREGHVVDHIDGDVRNCTRGNLRHVPVSANAFNKPGVTSSRSGIRGVYRCEGGWRVSLSIRHKQVNMGVHKTLEQARRAADAAIGLMYGRGTRLTDDRPFEESRVEEIVAGAGAIAPDNMGRLLARTMGLGDELSAELRRRLKEKCL